MRSVVEHLGTSAFPRLRIGIGRPASGSVAGWVLSPFSAAELAELETTVFPAALALLRKRATAGASPPASTAAPAAS